MKIRTNPIDELFSTLRPYFQKDNITRKDVNENPPLRSELFSTEQMDQHAQYLASTHSVTHEQAPEQLLKRLSDNEETLFRVNDLLQSTVKEKKTISPAGEWLLDNFYLIEEQIRIGKRYLPKGYSKGLPKLNKGPLAGFPRVYDIAIEIISHSDGHVDINSLSNFIAGYQKVSYLTLGELWAIPIMIRLALLENLGRVAARIAIDRIDTALANEWAKQIIEVAEKNPKDLVLILADMARAKPPMGSTFVAEFARKLQWKGPELSLPLNWVEQHLSDTDHTINSMVIAENQKQAADQVSVSNSINSLRFLAKIDWREFVETMSVVEQTLRSDLDGIYPKMDFFTRDQYRHQVEKIAKASTLSENEVANIAIELAKESYEHDKTDRRKSHVGYFLIDKGLKVIQKKTSVQLTLVESLRKFTKDHSYALYVIIAIIFTFSISAGLLAEFSRHTQSLIWRVLVGILCVLSASHLAIALTNWFVTWWIKPKPLPKLNFSTGIPNEHRTLVAIPTLLANPSQVEKLVEDLEVRFLANRDKNLLFALVTDFRDAKAETMQGDDELVYLARTRIEQLNERYGKSNPGAFFLFHRPRRWNAVDKVWMGYERKRGKLSELNHLLRGANKDKFSVIIGDERIYTTIKYIITLDTDTQLPRDAGWKLVGLMAHPLNQAVYDEKKKRVVEGYAIIQPRIAISLHGATRSGYTRLHENDAGIDPYTRVTSDVYQDIFHEGSFIGKGIYQIDAFEKALNNRFPENRILSHDLLEGSYTRCGFASDVQFYEDYPTRYSTDISRRHRWIRGDWQIGNWFLPFVPGSDKRLRKNSISALSRWKIFDNLRRSLIPVALLVLLIASWTVLSHPWFWAFCLTAIVILPSILLSTVNILRKPKEINIEQHFSNAIGTTNKNIFQAIFTLVCLPYEAFISIDAITRTLWRIYVSHKNLLEWNPSGFVHKQKETLWDTYRTMWISPALAIGVFSYLFLNSSSILFLAVPFLALWLLSPVFVAMLSKPLESTKTKLKEDQKIYLRELSRKTWSFFESLVGEEDNWLPPDNLQQYPVPVVAHRTSPTNIGLSLLANLSACDFGYATTTQLIERTTNTFSTMEKLERYNGHFYNWYDTQTLHVLNPKYISTVDSGNLAGHLLTLRQGFLTIPTQKIIDKNFLKGLQDTLRIVIKGTPEYERMLNDLHNTIPSTSFTVYDLKEYLNGLLSQYKSLIAYVQVDPSTDVNWWIQAFENQIKLFLQELHTFTPWVLLSPIPSKFKSWKEITEIPTLKQLTEIENDTRPELMRLLALENTSEEKKWLEELQESLTRVSQVAKQRIKVLYDLASQCHAFADMEYEFLYDRAQHLLTIGYNSDDHHADNSFYDLLASEARLSSFVAIAQGKIPQDNWFALGRRLTSAGNTPVLLSWSGSMFEYLMPSLVMPVYENTLLDEMCIGTVKKQIEYGEQLGIPWGISESCYNVVDAHLTYQYRAFGIPGLGFKRGLGQDMVIAPYATVLALMVDPQAACKNLEHMKARGFEGRYGFYEAIDYTPGRLSRGQSHAVIQTFMAHHQGMSLLALANILLDKPMQKRFEADTEFQTALLLLQEQVPKTTGYYSGSSDNENLIPALSTATEIRIIRTADTPVPEIQLLSNGRYHMMLSNAGGGYSRWKDLAVTRWREDSTCDNWGMFCYIRDLDSGEFWSNTHQPTLKEAQQYEAIFSQGRVEYRRRDNGVETYTEIIVSPEDDIEVRRIHLTNHSKTKRNLEITSYGEVVLAVPAADNSHPAFSNLFVQTEIKAHQYAIACTRRARSKEERPPWMFHLMKVYGTEATETSYETDRNKFIGRGHTLVHPIVMNRKEPLSGSQGSVLDPIVSIQNKLTLQAGESAIIDIVTGAADTQELNQSLIDKYQDRHLRDRAFELSWTHSQVVLRQIGATEADAQLYGKIASSIIYVNPVLRANSNVIIKNQRGQSALWSYSISGDLPIVLLQVSDSSNITIVKQLIKAQAYWQSKGLSVDLVILNEDASGYRQVLQDQIQGLVAAGIGVNTQERQGKIFVRPLDQILMEDFVLLQTVSRIIISDKKGTLNDQVNKRATVKTAIPKFISTKINSSQSLQTQPQENLQFFNGLGGFSGDGKEYVINLNENERTPLPWINVIANKNFGTIVTESGSSYTWFENAHEFRLTPWHNDPVSDKSGETFYLRDEEGGQFWSPLPQALLGEQPPYITRHGFGYTTFEHIENDISSEVSIHVDLEAAIKFIVIRVKNNSERARKLSATGYAEWVLGGIRSKSIMHIITELDIATGTIIAKNPYNTEFQSRVAFFGIDQTNYQYTTDRAEFIGRNGTLQNPSAMARTMLSGKSGASYDACAALQTQFELEKGQERVITFTLGAGKDKVDALQTIKRFQGNQLVSASLTNVKEFWQTTLGAVQVDTPDEAINILSNGWLLYQVLSCRLWGRSGFYQSGGAFGFRDQLQDVLALVHARPHLTREQIILCASRQFKEGDVQHWWHPPMGRGVRTLCSDDFLWLPFVTSKYVTATGDKQVLDETVHFLQGRQLNAKEESYYDLPIISDQQGTIYDHCKQAIEHGLRFGERGLPLMGSGDWNDGMNMVGIHGKGESIWLAFFLYDVLLRFNEIARARGDSAFVTKCEQEADKLKKNINLHAWDGEWYRRAYYDDGTPLGSASNVECKIDAIAQSWSVLSGAGEKDRSLTAMKSVNQFLINREKGLIQLLEPPFDTAEMDPGYIKGYVPGVRENGGQYTHAAIWMVMAFAKLGDRERTSELLNLINPINHGKTKNDVTIYKAEPYVMAADVYGVEPHTGRGGWTWYTGSAGWMYQLIIESFLGLKREGDTLMFEPCVPSSWSSFKVNYRFHETVYSIEIVPQTNEGQNELSIDGVSNSSNFIQLINDKQNHTVVLKCSVMKASGLEVGA